MNLTPTPTQNLTLIWWAWQSPVGDCKIFLCRCVQQDVCSNVGRVFPPHVKQPERQKSFCQREDVDFQPCRPSNPLPSWETCCCMRMKSLLKTWPPPTLAANQNFHLEGGPPVLCPGFTLGQHRWLSSVFSSFFFYMKRSSFRLTFFRILFAWCSFATLVSLVSCDVELVWGASDLS